MGSYKIDTRRSAEKEIVAIPQPDCERVVRKIKSLSSNPRPLGCEKLKGDTSFRLRQGDYRIIYTINDDAKAIMIEAVGHRREVYR